MSDTVFIENIPTQAVIGVHTFEKAAAQKLLVSVEMTTDIRQAAETDEVQYAFVRASRYELLEALAENLVAALFANFAMQSITLRLQKPGAITYTQQVGLLIHRQRP